MNRAHVFHHIFGAERGRTATTVVDRCCSRTEGAVRSAAGDPPQPTATVPERPTIDHSCPEYAPAGDVRRACSHTW